MERGEEAFEQAQMFSCRHSRRGVRFDHRKHDEEERDGRTVVEEAFAFEDEVEPTGNPEFFKYGENRGGVGGRNERAEEERHFERDVDAEEKESVPERESYEKRRYDERYDRKERDRTDVPKQFLIPDVVRRFEQEDGEEYVEEDVGRKFEIV